MTTTQMFTGVKNWVLEKIALIQALIPAQASSSNQLADKAFVNSSIATATATFRGTYNLVLDLSLTTSATQQQIAAALATKMAALSITPDTNDYVFVQVPDADDTPTVIARVDRYKYNGSAWAYEYSLNNSGFTAAQWAAINSGITAETWADTPEAVVDSESQQEFIDVYQSALQQLYQGITDAQNAKADYVGDDNYVYRWNATVGQYQRTNLYVKGDPGVTDYTQLENKPTKLSQFADDLGSNPVHSHNQYGLKSEMSVTPGTGANADKTTIQLKNGMTATVLVSHQSQASLVDSGSYNSTTKKIELKHGSTVLSEIDATAFIKDGMVSDVAITGGNLVITFNTDAGKQPISIPLTDIFNPANYYDKTATDQLLAAKANTTDLPDCDTVVVPEGGTWPF